MAMAEAMTGPGRRLADDPGLAPHLAYRLLKRSGETVSTTIDPQVQALAAAALRRQLIGLGRERARDGAVIVVDNATAEVLAYVGGVGGGSVDYVLVMAAEPLADLEQQWLSDSVSVPTLP